MTSPTLATAVASTVEEVRAWRRRPGSVGFVPTMGYLHDGHLRLVERATQDCDRVAVSLFVNPAQFDNPEDLARYPRDRDCDLRLLREAGVGLVFEPTPEALYPPGFDTWVEPGRVAAEQEGRQRPGHFRGVATVVLKLLNVVQPERAYFGRKDAQQLAVVRALVRDLDLATEIVPVDTVREADGLAMSSRNARLPAEERRAATVLYRALDGARRACAAGERDAEALRRRVRQTIAEEPLAELEYVSLADPDTLQELDRLAHRPAVLSLAARVGKVRLIDNVLIDNVLIDNVLIDVPLAPPAGGDA